MKTIVSHARCMGDVSDRVWAGPARIRIDAIHIIKLGGDGRSIMTILSIILIIALPVAGILGFAIRAYLGKIQLNSAEVKAQRIQQDAVKDAENKRKELLLEAKDQLLKEKNIMEKEIRDRRQELQNSEKRLLQKEEGIDKRLEQIEKQEKILKIKEQETGEKEEELKKEFDRHRKELEKIAGMSSDEAKQVLMKNLESEAKF